MIISSSCAMFTECVTWDAKTFQHVIGNWIQKTHLRNLWDRLQHNMDQCIRVIGSASALHWFHWQTAWTFCIGLRHASWTRLWNRLSWLAPMSNQRIPRQAKAVRILNEQMVLNVLAFNYNPHTDAIILKFSESPLAFLTRPTSRYERHVSQHGDVFVTLALL